MASHYPHPQPEPGPKPETQPAASMLVAMDAADANRVCRVCLKDASQDGELHFIFADGPVELGANLARILDECTLNPCERHDGMPSNMCGSCVEAARNAYRFKRNAERSYCSLVALLGRSPQLKKSGAEVGTQTDQVALLPCEMCHDQFLNSLELRLHRNRVHRTTKEGTEGSGAGEEFKCKFCPQHFPHLRQLRSHLARSHEQTARLQCAHCQRTFSRRDHLLRHMRNQHPHLDDDLFHTWPPVDETTMQSSAGDELVSAEVLLNEEEDDHDVEGDVFQCNTNPISSNEEDDDDDEDNVEAKQTLWLHIKPEPCLEAEEVDLATQLKLEKKRRRREKAEARVVSSSDSPVKRKSSQVPVRLST